MEAAEPGWPQRPPRPISAGELARLRRAAQLAEEVLPGPVGAIVARELRAYADFGYRFGPDSLLDQVTTDLLAAVYTRTAPMWIMPARRPAS